MAASSYENKHDVATKLKWKVYYAEYGVNLRRYSTVISSQQHRQAHIYINESDLVYRTLQSSKGHAYSVTPFHCSSIAVTYSRVYRSKIKHGVAKHDIDNITMKFETSVGYELDNADQVMQCHK
jgi:hypothetical protein